MPAFMMISLALRFSYAIRMVAGDARDITLLPRVLLCYAARRLLPPPCRVAVCALRRLLFALDAASITAARYVARYDSAAPLITAAYADARLRAMICAARRYERFYVFILHMPPCRCYADAITPAAMPFRLLFVYFSFSRCCRCFR